MVNEAFQVPANYSGKKMSNHFVGEKNRRNVRALCVSHWLVAKTNKKNGDRVLKRERKTSVGVKG